MSAFALLELRQRTLYPAAEMCRLASTLAFLIGVISNQVSAQTASPYGVSTIADAHKLTVFWFYPAVNETTLATVDDEPQSFLLYGTADCSARLASVFDLPNSICAVEAVEIRLWPEDPFPRLPGDQTSPFGLSVDTSLQADTTVVPIWHGTNLVPAPSTSGWQRFAIRTPVISDSVVVEFRWQEGTPTAPLPAVVFSSHFINSYIGALNNGGVEWSEVYDAVALMRVQINLADLDAGRCTGSLAPDSFSVFVFESPDEMDGYESMIVTVSDSLHIFLDRTRVEGKLAAVAAWHNGIMGLKSEIVQIDGATAVEDEVLPLEIPALAQNYPNPFNNQTVIFSSRQDEIVIYNVLGREVCRLAAIDLSDNGAFRFEWDGRTGSGGTLPSGVYFYRQQGSFGVKKLIMLK